jgi:hypothetical protein
MSPLAPGRIAWIGRFASPCEPVPTYSSPFAATGDAVGIAILPIRHSSLPSRPYAITKAWPVVTISVRSAFFQMKGVIQDERGRPVVGRSVFQSSAPVFASSAVM